MKASERNARFAREEAEDLANQALRRGLVFWFALACGVSASFFFGYLVPSWLHQGHGWIGAVGDVAGGLYAIVFVTLALGLPAFAAHVVAELLLLGLLRRRLASAWIAFGVGLIGSAVTFAVLFRVDRFWTGYWGFTALSVLLGGIASRRLAPRA